MSAPTAPADELRRRRDELTARLRRVGGVPCRMRDGSWSVDPAAPATLVREWLRLDEMLASEEGRRGRG